ncbi:MAG: LysM peptidoglycan-binding domain-containing protein [bacterium]|nr:LysM peptidoglycan-binding domain-containing protein [bacterium]
MRTDVRLGLLFSFVAVVVAGWFYASRGSTAEPLALDDATPATKAQVDKGTLKKPSNSTHASKPEAKRRGNRRATPRTTAKRPSNTPTQSSKRGANSPRVAGRRGTGRANLPAQDGSQQLRPSPKTTTVAGRDAATPPDKSVGTEGSETDRRFKFDRGTSASNTPSAAPADAVVDASPGNASPKKATKRRNDRPVGRAASPKAPEVAPSTSRLVNKTAAPERTHAVQRGDSYSLLADTYYGSQRHTQFLIDANPEHPDPKKLRIGDVLKIPPLPKDLASAKPPVLAAKVKQPNLASAGRTYTAREGDTFYDIAARELGSASRWTELFELNREVVHGNAKRLRVGQVLVLPPQATVKTKSDS